jgi:phosphate uptake regulator
MCQNCSFIKAALFLFLSFDTYIVSNYLVGSNKMDNTEIEKLENQNEETRKIQYTGGSSYIVSLPKKWIQDLKLKQGDLVAIVRMGQSSLQISPVTKRINKEQREATIEVTKDNSPYFLARKLISIYFLGFNVINISQKDGGRMSGQQREVLKDVVRRVLMGTEIIADSATTITLQVLINLLELSVDGALKRMVLIAKSMHRDAILSLRENNVELAKEILKSDDEVDRFSFYIVRQLNIAIKNEHLLKEIGLDDSRNCLGYRSIAKSTERIADHAGLIAKDIIEMEKPMNSDIVEKITEMSNFALDVLEEACLSVFKRDYDSADLAIEKSRNIDDLEKGIVSVASKLKDINEIYRVKIITENIRRVAEYASDIAEIVLNMTVQQKLRKG